MTETTPILHRLLNPLFRRMGRPTDRWFDTAEFGRRHPAKVRRLVADHPGGNLVIKSPRPFTTGNFEYIRTKYGVPMFTTEVAGAYYVGVHE